MGLTGLWGRLSLLVQGHGGGEHGGGNIGEIWGQHIVEEVSDAHHWAVPPFGWPEVHLPQWPPIHIGPLVIDLSPTKHVVVMLLAAIICAAILIWTARRTRAREGGRAPSGLANLIEAFVIYLRDEVAMRGIGPGGERYVPFVLTLFFFIFFMNILGLVPFGATATGNLSVTAALAILALVAIEVMGAMELGLREYSKTVVVVPEGLPWYGQALMAMIMIPVETLAKFSRIFALAIRLFANMTAGHFVLLSLVGLIFVAGAAGADWVRWVSWPAPVLMAVAVMLLEIFVALLQAYIFAMLTAVFIGLVRHAH